MTTKTTHIIDRFRINFPHFEDNHVHCNLTKYFEYGKKKLSYKHIQPVIACGWLNMYHNCSRLHNKIVHVSFINSFLIHCSHPSKFTKCVDFYLQRNNKHDFKTSSCITNLLNNTFE